MSDRNETSATVDLGKRTKALALRVIRLCGSLPRNHVTRVLGDQVLKCGTSVGAHYREGRRARSSKEYVSKLGGALMELGETAYWFELLVESEIVKTARLKPLLAEVDELIAILTVCKNKADAPRPPRNNKPKRKDHPSE
ncbi:MAG: four helix bundle protein [Planctomycetaceae bacterium]